MFKNCSCPNAKLSDNKLVLSLPDAMTPVVWMIDMADTGTFAMKVEQSDNGLYVLQKISKDKNLEDIAYYTSKAKAVKAMTVITNTMNGGRANSSTLWRVLGFLKTALVVLASIGLITVFLMLFFPKFERLILGNPYGQQQMTQPTSQQAPTQAPVPQGNSDAFGVPMSADDFLNNNGNSSFPF